MNKQYIFLASASLIIASLLSLFASSSPDGLEKVAEDKGFIFVASNYPFATLMPEYGSGGLSTSIAGIMGVCLVFVLCLLMLKFVLWKKSN